MNYSSPHSTDWGGGNYLSLPADFIVPEADRKKLLEAAVQIIAVPRNLSLGQSVLFSLEHINCPGKPLRLLHGDTLIYDLPRKELDIVTVAECPGEYDWGFIGCVKSDESSFNAVRLATDTTDKHILSGYFAFSNSYEFQLAIKNSGGDFLRALSIYQSIIGLRFWSSRTWLDFGHLQTFYRSRCSLKTQRAFNELDMSFHVVKKKSRDQKKISAEADWYNEIPKKMRLYTPAFLGRDQSHDKYEYDVEYLPIPSVNDLFVFGNVDRGTWTHIIDSCFRFMRDCLSEGLARKTTPFMKPVIKQLTIEKTEERLALYESLSGISIDQEWRYAGKKMPSLYRISKLAADAIDIDETRYLGVMHGDFCFSNIFFDCRTRRIRVIDPRGTVDGLNSSIFGDVRYDLAKLNHSICGGYDYIMADRAVCEGFDARDMTIHFPSEGAISWLPDLASEFELCGLKISDQQIAAIAIHLFLGMLPLHSDRPDHQQAFIANALRLFSIKLRDA